MTPESRNSGPRIDVHFKATTKYTFCRGNYHARNNRRTSASMQRQGKYFSITIEELLGNGVFCWGRPEAITRRIEGVSEDGSRTWWRRDDIVWHNDLRNVGTSCVSEQLIRSSIQNPSISHAHPKIRDNTYEHIQWHTYIHSTCDGMNGCFASWEPCQPMFRRNISPPFSWSKIKPSKWPAWKQLLCLPAALTLHSCFRNVGLVSTDDTVLYPRRENSS
jgi:hypothetical protein